MFTKHLNNIRKIVTAIVLMILCLTSCIQPSLASSISDVQVMSAPLTRQSSSTNGMVRVYLSSLGSPTTLNLTAVGKYSINGNTSQTINSGSNLVVNFSSSTGAITLTYNGVKTNMGTYFALRRHSTTGTNGMKIAESRDSSNPYPGDISFRAVAQGSGYKLYTIAHVYIENYLYGVLPYEMGNSSNIEALKAQAVAARTYTVGKMQTNASSTYDVVDTTSDQVYRGTPSGNANCVAAVDGTKGIVIMNGSRLTSTYYSASNGGQMESIKNIWGSSGYDYLDVKDDPFDYANSSSTVKKTTIYTDLQSSMNNTSLKNLLRNKVASKLNTSSANVTLGTLKSVTPHTPMYASPSRLYTKMDFSIVATVNGTQQTTTVTCDIFSELESMLSMSIQSSKNELWSVQKSGTSFVLQARRYGHGLGMSQRGAMYMAKLGYTYDQILGFYYPGCSRVQKSFTNTILDEMGSTQTTVEDPASLGGETDAACKGTVKLVKADATLAIRAEKSTSAALVGSASNGAILSVLSNDGTWCFVQYGNLKGYVPTNALSIVGTPPNQEGTSSTIIGFATVTASDFVNLRSSGSMSGSVVSTAPANSVLTVFSKDGSWAHVQYNATVAYVNTNYISAVTSTYPSTVVSTGNQAATVATEDGTGSVNMRSSASTSASVLAEISHGSEITVLSDDGSWCRVSYNGTTGYIVSEFISYVGESLENNGESGNTGEGGNESGGNEGETGADGKVTIVSSGASLLMLPMDEGELIVFIAGGESVVVTERGNLWCFVTYGEDKGYIPTSSLNFGSESGNNGDVLARATVTTDNGSLNMRAEARAGSQIMTTIPRGMEIDVTLIGTTWCGVRYNGYNGYVMSSFLTFSQGQGEGTGGNEGGTTTGETTAIVTTQSGSLNLRIAARSGSQILRTIPQFATVAVHERGASWSNVTYEGTTGYVMTVFLTFADEEQPVTDPVTDPSEGGNEEDPNPDDPDDPDEPITPDPGDAESLYATVTTVSGSLNLRSDAFPGSRVLASIPKGATIIITQQYAAWSQTTYAGLTGYVMNSFLTFRQGKPEELTGDTAVVSTVSGSLNMRLEPSVSAGVLSKIPQYATVGVEQRGATWCYVSYNNAFGYVMTQYLTLSDDAVETDTTEESTTEAPTQESTTLIAYVQTSSGSLNLRETPQSNSRVIETLPRNSSVVVRSYGDTWCEVSADEIVGYAMTKFLRLDTTTALTAQVETPTDTTNAEETKNESENTTQSNAETEAWVITDAGPLNLREEAVDGATVLTSIPRYASVTVVHSNGIWSYIGYNTVYGYVRSSFLSNEKPIETSSEAPVETPTETPEETGNTEDQQQEQPTEESNGPVLDSTMRTPSGETFAWVVPYAGNSEMSVWRECEEKGNPLTTLPEGAAVEILLEGETWCKIDFMGEEGYCLLNHLSI